MHAQSVAHTHNLVTLEPCTKIIAIVNGYQWIITPWKNTATFNGICEIWMAPPPQVEANDVLQWGYVGNMFLQEGWHLHFNNLVKVYGIKCVPSLFNLEYWKVLFVVLSTPIWASGLKCTCWNGWSRHFSPSQFIMKNHICWNHTTL
jgi:hypothetical protein